MKKTLICLLVIFSLLMSLVACTSDNHDERIDAHDNLDFQDGVKFYFSSNKYNEGTCTLIGIYIPESLEGTTVTIPSFSPEGETVTACKVIGQGTNVPLIMTQTDFESKILNNLDDGRISSFEKRQILSFYQLKDVTSYMEIFTGSENMYDERAEFLEKYPLAEKNPIYIFTGSQPNELDTVSTILTKLDYTYEDNLKNTEKLIELAGLSKDKVGSVRYPTTLHRAGEIILPHTIKTVFCLSGAENVKEIIIPEGTTDIGDSTFMGCTALERVTIPRSVTGIGYNVFAECTALSEITFYGTANEWMAISKEHAWDSGTGDYIVKCTDIYVTKDDLH